jgi:superfamily I DNA/RNA helicase
MIDPQTNALLLLYDDAQDLYGKHKQQAFSFKSVGIQAQGRTTILKLNYRNTQEILGVAYAFAKQVLAPTDRQQEDAPILVQPQSVGRRGAQPELIRLPSFRQEVEYLLERIQQVHERGVAWNEIAILYRSKFMGQQICNRLQQMQIPVEWINASRESRHYQPEEPSIKLMTMHASKGLEFPVVFIPGLGFMPSPNLAPEPEARLLYVSMTRAIDHLILTCDRPSAFVRRVEAALENAR